MGVVLLVLLVLLVILLLLKYLSRKMGVNSRSVFTSTKRNRVANESINDSMITCAAYITARTHIESHGNEVCQTTISTEQNSGHCGMSVWHVIEYCIAGYFAVYTAIHQFSCGLKVGWI